jgi:hypothetical protein
MPAAPVASTRLRPSSRPMRSRSEWLVNNGTEALPHRRSATRYTQLSGTQLACAARGPAPNSSRHHDGHGHSRHRVRTRRSPPEHSPNDPMRFADTVEPTRKGPSHAFDDGGDSPRASTCPRRALATSTRKPLSAPIRSMSAGIDLRASGDRLKHHSNDPLACERSRRSSRPRRGRCHRGGHTYGTGSR